MSRPTIRPAQGSDFSALQAMSCSGDDSLCYPSFCTAAHKFLIATDGSRIVGFICAYPGKDQQTHYVRLLQPYLYTNFRGQGIEDDLRAAVLQWAEEKLDYHFFKEDPYRLHPIKPHQYLESLKYDGQETRALAEPEPVAAPALQTVYAPLPEPACG